MIHILVDDLKFQNKIHYLPEAAEASDPSSLTSMTALCTASDSFNGSFACKSPLKSAVDENISAMPN